MEEGRVSNIHPAKAVTLHEIGHSQHATNALWPGVVPFRNTFEGVCNCGAVGVIPVAGCIFNALLCLVVLYGTQV